MINRLSPLTKAAPFLPVPRKTTSESAPTNPSDDVTLSGSIPVAQKSPGRKILLGALTAVSGLAGLAGTAAVIIHGAQKSPSDTIKDLTKGDAQSIAQMQKTMAPVDAKILHLAQKEGVTYQLLNPGDDLLQTGALQPRPPGYVHDQLPQIQEFVSQLRKQTEIRFDKPMAQLTDFGTHYQQLAKDRTTFVLDQLEAAKLPIKFFTLPTPGDLPFNLSMAQFGNMPQSITAMAAIHGAKTPEQIKEFTELVKAINGDTYTQAVQQTADRMTDFKRMGMNLNQKPFNEAEFRQGLLKNQDMLPVDHRAINLLVPDLYYTSAGKLDNHDRSSLESWSGQRNAKGELSTDGRINGDQNSIRGEYFQNGRILLRSSETGKRAPIHELGHAMEHILQKRDPQFYKNWKAGVQTNYDQMMKNVYGPGGGTESITPYAETNVGEYIAEGFAHYHLTPEEFKAKDPKFYESIECFINRLQQLDQADRPQTLGEYVTSLFKD